MADAVLIVILVALGVIGPVVAIAATPRPSRPSGSSGATGSGSGVVRGAVVAGLLVAVTGGVFALVADRGNLDVADLPVLGWMIARRTPGLTALAEGLAVFGGTVVTGGLAVVSAVVLAVRGRWRWAVVWVAAVALGATTIRLLKEIVERPRPPVATRLAEETTTSLPSGHSLMAALGLGLVAAAVVLTGRRAAAVVAIGVAVLAALAIGMSRAYLGVHWTTDVLAGWLLGAALVTVAVTVGRAVAEPIGCDAGHLSAPRGRPVGGEADTDVPDRSSPGGRPPDGA